RRTRVRGSPVAVSSGNPPAALAHRAGVKSVEATAERPRPFFISDGLEARTTRERWLFFYLEISSC
ncbi:hypothetical protein, partial [Scytonema sp. NUACC26]|uniref:hypothetical protein n=1 Tax=Scytonema sp. NUACC26 TaxID=3140176 RepID=UPI0038B344D6